jgi:hypothetical protein
MNEQQLAAVKQAVEALDIAQGLLADAKSYHQPKMLAAYTALQSIISQDALEKMAKDARTIGLRLDDWDKIGCVNHDCDQCKAVQEPVFCEYCGGNDDADFGLPTDHCTDCARPQPDYAWPTIADYEKEVGFEVNDAFKAAWTMARTTNDLFKQMGENT